MSMMSKRSSFQVEDKRSENGCQSTPAAPGKKKPRLLNGAFFSSALIRIDRHGVGARRHRGAALRIRLPAWALLAGLVRFLAFGGAGFPVRLGVFEFLPLLHPFLWVRFPLIRSRRRDPFCMGRGRKGQYQDPGRQSLQMSPHIDLPGSVL